MLLVPAPWELTPPPPPSVMSTAPQGNFGSVPCLRRLQIMFEIIIGILDMLVSVDEWGGGDLRSTDRTTDSGLVRGLALLNAPEPRSYRGGDHAAAAADDDSKMKPTTWTQCPTRQQKVYLCIDTVRQCISNHTLVRLFVLSSHTMGLVKHVPRWTIQNNPTQ